jgi:acyl carrier protein
VKDFFLYRVAMIGLEMLNRNLQDVLIGIVSEVLNDESISITSSSRDNPSWDSLAQLLIMMKIEETIKIRIKPDELASMTSVLDIIAIVKKHPNAI